jgi:hypothetical protein
MVDSDGHFQFDEIRQYDGPDRITGIMLISAPGNVKQAIGNLLIKLEGDAHQIRYKPTQQKIARQKDVPWRPLWIVQQGHHVLHQTWVEDL